MKRAVQVASMILLVAVSLAVGSCARDKSKFGFYVPKANEEIYGTWANMDYGREMYPQKIINYHWGSYDLFLKATDVTPTNKGANTIVAKWVDKEGNTWFKTYYREDWTRDVFFELDRISNKGSVWEFCFDQYDFPKEDDIKSKNGEKNFRVFYRQ